MVELFSSPNSPLLRAVYKQWVPHVGATHALNISRAMLWRLVRLPVSLAFFLVALVAQTSVTYLGQTTAIVLIIAAFAVGIAFRRVSTVGVDRASRAIRAQIDDSGQRLNSEFSLPNLRTPTQFLRWCREEGVTLEHIVAE